MTLPTPANDNHADPARRLALEVADVLARMDAAGCDPRLMQRRLAAAIARARTEA